jgi:hypothetical protein
LWDNRYNDAPAHRSTIDGASSFAGSFPFDPKPDQTFGLQNKQQR